MVFSSIVFVMIFLPSVLIIASLLYLILKRSKKSGKFIFLNLFLLISSLIFYFYGEPNHIIVMLCVTAINYIFGVLISKSSDYRKLMTAIGVILNICVLGYFKYFNFFMDIIGIDLMNAIINDNHKIKTVISVALPLGISFYIFQGISYLIDVYRGDVKATANFINFACYITLFPQLVAGPIVRYSQIEQELTARKISAERFSKGAARFIMGLAKKLLIADTLGRVADAAFAVPHGELSAIGAWLGIVSYSLQIYFDFSAYSDMAIGIGNMLGFTFPENFNYPYISKSAKEFWRRWHISLSSWFRDYLYIPLGGNRAGRTREYFNQIIVFALCGLWHGASVMFLLWGLYHGFFLTIEKLFPKILDKIPVFFRHIYAIFMFMFGWVLFRANDMEQALNYYKSLFGSYGEKIHEGDIWLNAFAGDYVLALIIGIVLSAPVFPFIKKKYDDIVNSANAAPLFFILSARNIMLLVLLVICFMPLFGSSFKAFIYFRF